MVVYKEAIRILSQKIMQIEMLWWRHPRQLQCHGKSLSSLRAPSKYSCDFPGVPYEVCLISQIYYVVSYDLCHKILSNLVDFPIGNRIFVVIVVAEQSIMGSINHLPDDRFLSA